LSQETAALKGQIDRAYYGHVERGSKSPTLGTIWRIAAALDVPPSALFLRAEHILAQKPARASKSSHRA